MKKRSQRLGAFTLLEVLAAVAILGVLYTTLAGVAVEGLRAEGESKRRLEASLLADERLAALEAELEAGTVPAPGEEEEEIDAFTIAVKVEDFELPGEDEPTRGDATIFPSSSNSSVPAPLKMIEVSVRWDEAGFERRLVRTTYAFDSAAVSSLLVAAGAAAIGGAGGGSGGVDAQSVIRRLGEGGN